MQFWQRIIVVSFLILAGCGGDDDGKDTNRDLILSCSDINITVLPSQVDCGVDEFEIDDNANLAACPAQAPGGDISVPIGICSSSDDTITIIDNPFGVNEQAVEQALGKRVKS